MTEEEIRAEAIEFAKRNKNRIAKELTDPATYAPDLAPISAFMAGSPGAGKTEFSKSLIEILEKNSKHRVVRIDGDEIRVLLPEYTGSNSHLFQGAVSLIVEKIHDLVLRKKQSFVFDSTFARYEKAVDNVNRSLEKGRPISIFYLYQEPEIAWRFTQAREAAEGRNIPKTAFIDQFLSARETIGKIFNAFKDKITIRLVKKDFEKNIVENIYKITMGKPQIDQYIGKEYTKDMLEKIL